MRLGEAAEASRRQMPINTVDRLNEGGPTFFEQLASHLFDQPKETIGANWPVNSLTRPKRHMGRLAHGWPGHTDG
ncbi:hypothetical protein Nepgr_033479 [Nepenthes gracilis]|uniref:Uncharacterized protein n=1 Tax=Nepenthes gracilis TaxID=150966 RepID=A0AAD3Y8E7_NEPGR|nr:hypothetical protein Nepgr_033479 [Nepenthes gracilis]